MALHETNMMSKSCKAGSAISANTILKMGADDDSLIPATAVSETLIGVAVDAIASGDYGEVMLSGIARVKIGGTVTRGDKITTNASAQGVTAAPGAGTNNGIIGIALMSGVANDIIPVLLSQGVMQG